MKSKPSQSSHKPAIKKSQWEIWDWNLAFLAIIWRILSVLFVLYVHSFKKNQKPKTLYGLSNKTREGSQLIVKWDSQYYIILHYVQVFGQSQRNICSSIEAHNVGLCKLGTCPPILKAGETLVSSSSLHFGRPFGNTPSFRSHWRKAISKTFHWSFYHYIFSRTSLIPGRRFRHTLHSLSFFWTLWTQLIPLFICVLKP